MLMQMQTQTQFTLHPACAAWPAMPDDELGKLARDIEANGLLEPLTLTPDGLLLDGRCRQEACVMIGREITPDMTVIYNGDPIAFSASKNCYRRHLTLAQRAFAVEALAKLNEGAPIGNQRARKQLVLKEPVVSNNQSMAQLAEAAVISPWPSALSPSKRWRS